jgi:NADH:ubiquinone oxidoreductase subunit
MSLGTFLYTKFYGQLVGEDSFGNKYYRSKKKSEGAHIGRTKDERRWVVYNGMVDASKIPPEWHGWTHYITDDYPKAGKKIAKHGWQKPHIPNMTGTGGAYFPKGQGKSGGKRNKTSGDYEAWNPES